MERKDGMPKCQKRGKILKMKPKVLEIIPSLNGRGGAEVFVYSLLCAFLNNSKWDFHLLLLYNGMNKTFDDLFKRMPGKIHFANKRPGIDFMAAKACRQVISEIKPDIIHSNLSTSITLFLSLLRSKQKPPICHTVHNIAEHEAETKGDYFAKKFLLNERELTFVGISTAISDSIKNFYKTSNVVTIYNGVFLRKPNIPIGPKKYDFICVARFYEQKNHALLLRAFKKVVDVKKTARLVLCGDGPLLPKMMKLAEDLGVASNIYFAGHVNDPYPYLLDSRVFVLSSNYEGNPISILEAMDCSLPIIATAVGGVPDVVKNGWNGITIPKGSESSLASAMLKSITNPTDYCKMGENGKKASSSYDIAVCAQNYLSLFNRLINK